MSYDIRSRNGYQKKKLRERMRHKYSECALCGKPLDWDIKTPHPMSVEVDHIIPVSKGGASNYRMLYGDDNCQAVHRICNQRKGNKMPKEYASEPSHMHIVTSRKWNE